MLYPHSLLWHYLWVGPHILQLILAVLLWRHGINRALPIFFAYIIYEAFDSLTLYAMDISPLVDPKAWWVTDCAFSAVEGLLKFAVVWEVFSNLTRSRPSQARLAKTLILEAGVALFALAVWAAIHAPSGLEYRFTACKHILGQTIYMITSGLWLSTFALAAFLRLRWNRWTFGIALGASISSCIHLATFGVFANAGWFKKEYLLDFLSMGTYQMCVLVWCYYLLSPKPKSRVFCEDHSDSIRSTSGGATLKRLLPAS